MRIPSPVRCVLFDAVGTLVYADPPVSAVYAAAAHDFGLKLDEATIEGRFVAAFAKHYASRRHEGDNTTNEDRERGRWRAIVADVFPEIAPGDGLFQRLWSHFAQPTSWRLYEDAALCWQRLKRAGLQVGIASNFDERLLTLCAGLPPLNRCDHIFTSSQLGWRKPAPQFFCQIEEATQLTPHELLLIGDDWESDYVGATHVGWHAVYLDRSANSAADDSAVSSLAHVI